MYIYIYIYTHIIYIYIYRERERDILPKELRPSEHVDLFVNAGGGEWRPAKLDEIQCLGATPMGYRVNWSEGLLALTPAERLRRRFVPDEQVYVYRGVQGGWAVGHVRGGRASGDGMARTKVLEDSFPPDRQRSRMAQLLGDWHGDVRIWAPPQNLGSSRMAQPLPRPAAPCPGDSMRRSSWATSPAWRSSLATILVGAPAQNDPANPAGGDVPMSPAKRRAGEEEEARAAALISASELALAGQGVEMRWWYWVQVEAKDLAPCSAPLARLPDDEDEEDKEARPASAARLTPEASHGQAETSAEGEAKPDATCAAETSAEAEAAPPGAASRLDWYPTFLLRRCDDETTTVVEDLEDLAVPDSAEAALAFQASQRATQWAAVAALAADDETDGACDYDLSVLVARV